jgi:hypothetical protein
VRRREFITLIGGGAAAWPLVAGAQSKVARIGALYIGLADAESQPIFVEMTARRLRRRIVDAVIVNVHPAETRAAPLPQSK